MMMRDCDGTQVEPGDKITVVGTLDVKYDVIDVPADSVFALAGGTVVRFNSKYVRKVVTPVLDMVGTKIKQGDKLYQVNTLQVGHVVKINGADEIKVSVDDVGTRYWRSESVLVLA